MQLNHTPSEEILNNIELLSLTHIAKEIKAVLNKYGALSLAQISQYLPIHSGLEGLVAYIRIAKVLNATEINEKKEQILCYDKYGNTIQATIPLLMLSEHLFMDIDNLSF